MEISEVDSLNTRDENDFTIQRKFNVIQYRQYHYVKLFSFPTQSFITLRRELVCFGMSEIIINTEQYFNTEHISESQSLDKIMKRHFINTLVK